MKYDGGRLIRISKGRVWLREKKLDDDDAITPGTLQQLQTKEKHGKKNLIKKSYRVDAMTKKDGVETIDFS